VTSGEGSPEDEPDVEDEHLPADDEEEAEPPPDDDSAVPVDPDAETP
jgi:hypothetical protein